MTKYLPVFVLIVLGIAARFLPHPANFAPIGAIAIFSGIYLPKRWALILPLAAMFFSDLFIGFYAWPIMLSVYVSFMIMAVIGLGVRKNKKLSTVLGGTILGSVMFYLVTNGAVWAFGSLYPPTAAGLIESYYMAIPFFKNSLLGDLFYTGVLVGAYEASLALLYRKKKAAVIVEINPALSRESAG
ncbi:MAG: hypothetical protein HYV53_01480 [Parcubacteria group bacterium]|nr:hypothetical protein [Parcubacteria group bacterium]